MKILQAIWSLASENGGPTRSIIGLSTALSRIGVDVTLVSHVPGKLSLQQQNMLKEYNVNYQEGRGNGILTALKDSRELLSDIKPDIVHVNGLWKMSAHAMCIAAFERCVPIVISPRGMLDPWALSVKKWKKKLGLLLYQRNDLSRASAIHVTSELEANHVREFGLRQPVILAANGVMVPSLNIAREKSCKSVSRARTAIFVSRLHPGKGLILLADAWAALHPSGWKMVVVGPDGYGHKAEVCERLRQLGIESDWKFVGELNDNEKWRALANADLFIHPSASENFGVSIAEALASGLPVITTKGCPWSEIHGTCGWWIDRNVQSLVCAIREAMSISDDERGKMGERGRQLILKKYTWTSIAEQMVNGYKSMLIKRN